MSGPESPAVEHHSTISYNARLGLILFVIYLAIYGVFVGLCAFKYTSMAEPWLGGVNVAVWYGFVLIVGAFVMAVIYLAMCRK